jgi:acetolactate synthase-1/2/3 large subunit
MKANGAEIVTTLLERQGVGAVAGIPGGANLPLYDALGRSRIRHVLARHEQGAGFIAQGMARVTGRAAVCLGTSGPGATNLLTAIADARLDSIPLVAITGQVPSALIGTDAFQEVDTYGLTAPITKHNYLVRRASELLSILPEAFEIAESGRPGPVVIDIPKDVLLQEVELEAWPEMQRQNDPPEPDPAQVTALARAIDAAERPVLYVGGGVIASGASDALRRVAHKSSIPVTTTLPGLGAIAADDVLSLGMLGMHGAQYTNRVLDEADLLVALGARFDDRATGKLSEFCEHARIAHVDIDPSEIDKLKPTNMSIVADVGATLRALLPRLKPRRRRHWNDRVVELHRQYPMVDPPVQGRFQPRQLIEQLARLAEPDCIIATDVGQHQMWVAQYFPFRRPRSLLTSGGLGTMGFGLPAAIGAALAKPHQRVICVTGDGSLLMNVQELATLAELELPVTVVLMNNGHLGLVRQQQELFYGARYQASRFERSPDFVRIAEGFGVHGVALGGSVHPEQALREALQHSGPTLVDVPIPPMENVLPMVPPGASNRTMIDREACHG